MRSRASQKNEWQHYYRFALAITRDEGEAYDLVHSVVRSFLEKGRDPTKLARAYVFRALRNQYIDGWRRQQKYQFEEYDEDKVASIEPLDFTDCLIKKGEAEAILKGLGPQERELLYLNIVEEFTVAEIAKTMDQPRGTILSQLHRLKQKIKKRLAKGTGS